MQVQASNKWLIALLLMVLVSLVSTGVLYLVEVLIVIVVSISQSVECFIWDGTDSLKKSALTNVSIESSPSILDPSTLTWFDACFKVDQDFLCSFAKLQPSAQLDG